jgi:hypothetical protein
MVPDGWRAAPTVESSDHHIERFEPQETIMPILLWLLGVPISLILVLMLLGAA